MNQILTEDFARVRQYFSSLESFRGTRWLITGSTGMTGSYLLSFLSYLNETVFDGSIHITAPVRMKIEYDHPNVGSLVNKDYLDFRVQDLSSDFTVDDGDSYDYVFHGASPAAPRDYQAHPIETIFTNVFALKILLDSCRESTRIRCFLTVSSGEIYGSPNEHHIPTEEDYHGLTDHLSPRSCYVESKRFGETLAWNYYSVYGVPVRIIRPVHMYGPGFSLNDSRVWADFINAATLGRNIEIKGDGLPRRGFCYLADALVSIILVFLRGKNGEVYNIGNEHHVSIKEFADITADASPHRIEVLVRNQLPDYLKGSPSISCPSTVKVSTLGDVPFRSTSLEEGIRRCIKWRMMTSGQGG